MRSLLNGDNSFFAHIMTILRGALLDTGVLCQLDVSFDDVTSNQSDAFHFQFVRSFTESLQSGQAGADGNHECSSDLVKDIVWWHALLLLEASGSDISRLCAILLPVASKNCYGLFYSATLYPLLFPDFGCVFSLCTDDMAKLCGEQSPFEDKEKLLYMVKKQQQTNVSLIALRDYLDMKIGPAQFLLTMSGLISTGDSMAQLVQESFWEMELVFNNNSAHPLEIVACWLMIGMQEKYLSLSNFPRLQSSMSCYTFITAIDTSFMLKMVTGVVIIVLDNFQHEPGNLTDCFHYAVEVIKNNLSIRVTHSQTAGISLFSSAKFIELIDVICLMNVFVAYCESEGITMADCLLQCVGRKIPGSSFLFEHFINQIESLHRNNPTGSACEAFLCAVRSGRCSYARIIDLSCECSQEMYSHSDKLKVHCTIANFFEEKLVGERSRAGSEHITMHYYGLKWCGYSVLKNMDSLLLLRLGMSCFWAEKYLCVYAIQQELFKRSDFGAFDVACCVHLMTHTAFSVPSDFASANVACIYPIMEPEVNIFQTSEKRDRRLLTVIPKPLVAVNLINASTLPKKCSLDGLLNGAIPFALSLAQQLKELNLSACSLVVYPIHLLRLNNLVRLILSHNMLQNLPTDHFSNAYPGLIYLDLSFNKYTSLPSELSRLLNLQELYMNDNRIEYIPDRLLQMKSLRVFDLSNNLLKALPPGIIALRKQIQYLKLSGNPMIQSVAGRIKLPFPTILSSDTTSRVGLVKRNLDSNATPEFTKYHLQKKIRLKSQITEVGTDFDNAILIADKFDSSQQVASGELVDHDEIFQCETRVEPVLAIASTCSSSVKGAEDRSDADVSVQKVKQNLSEFTPFGAL